MSQNNFQIQFTIFITVLLGYISYALPYPIFSPLLLTNSNGILPEHISTLTRTILLGFAFILYPLGQLLGSPLVGRVSDQCGRKEILIFTLLGAGLCDFLVGLGIHYHQLWLVLFSLFFGGFCASNITIAQSIAADLSTLATKAKNFSNINIAINLGWILGCLLGGKLADPSLHHWFDYSTPFYFSAICYLANIVLVFYSLPSIFLKNTYKEKLTKISFISSFLSSFNQKPLRIMYGYSLLIFIASYLFFCYFSVFMVQKFSFGPSQLANFEAYLAVPLILANYLLRPLLKHFNLQTISAFGLFALALSLVIFILPSSFWGMLFTVPLVACWLTFSEVTSSLLISDNATVEEQGLVMGTYRAIMVLGEIIASLAGGVLAGINLNLPFVAAASVAIAAGCILLLVKSYHKI